MRKTIVILGIMFTITVLITGSAVAAWVYGWKVEDSDNVTNENYILGSPDPYDATLGRSSPNVLGWILIDMGSSNALPPNTEFTVFAGGSDESEDYIVGMSEDLSSEEYIGQGDDQSDHDFTSPSSGSSWRYIRLSGTTGSIGGSDTIYGPEIDAVGWDKP